MNIATTKALYSTLTAARFGAVHSLVANDSEGNMAKTIELNS
ncbi:hypothetical protein [Pedobacter sp. MC2016-24]|nr:hypothetical protein [Pedobacter sp. MC2016-24]